MKRLRWWLVLALTVVIVSFWHVNQESTTPLAYNVRGSHAVGVRTITTAHSPALEITVWYPAIPDRIAGDGMTYSYAGLFELTGYALDNAEIDQSAAPYPAVLFSHASGGYRLQSAYLAEHLASYGFIVIAPDHDDSIRQVLLGVDVTEAIPASLQQRPADLWASLTAVAGVMGDSLDMDRVILVGHSLGATTALLMAGAKTHVDGLNQWCETSAGYTEICVFDPQQIAQIQLPEPEPNILGVVALAPWNGPALDVSALRDDGLPVLIMAAEADQVAPIQRDALPIYAALDPEQAFIVVLGQAGHFVFVGTCPDLARNTALVRFCSDEVWDMERVHSQIVHYVSAFALAVVFQDASAIVALDAGTMLWQVVP